MKFTDKYIKYKNGHKTDIIEIKKIKKIEINEIVNIEIDEIVNNGGKKNKLIFWCYFIGSNVEELILLIESFINFNYTQNLIIFTDKKCYQHIKTYNNYPCIKVLKLEYLNKYSNKNRNIMEKEKIWDEFMLLKCYLGAILLDYFDWCWYLDTDIVILDKLFINLEEKYCCYLFPHYILKNVENRYGRYNGGSFITRSKDYLYDVVNLTNKKIYYTEQQPLEKVISENKGNKYSIFEVDDNFNFGWWRMFQQEYKDIIKIRRNFKIKGDEIFYRNKKLKFIHTHFLKKETGIVSQQSKQFNQFILNMIYETRSNKYNFLLNKVKIKSFNNLVVNIPSSKHLRYNDALECIIKNFENKNIDFIHLLFEDVNTLYTTKYYLFKKKNFDIDCKLIFRNFRKRINVNEIFLYAQNFINANDIVIYCNSDIFLSKWNHNFFIPNNTIYFPTKNIIDKRDDKKKYILYKYNYKYYHENHNKDIVKTDSSDLFIWKNNNLNISNEDLQNLNFPFGISFCEQKSINVLQKNNNILNNYDLIPNYELQAIDSDFTDIWEKIKIAPPFSTTFQNDSNNELLIDNSQLLYNLYNIGNLENITLDSDRKIKLDLNIPIKLDGIVISNHSEFITETKIDLIINGNYLLSKYNFYLFRSGYKIKFNEPIIIKNLEITFLNEIILGPWEKNNKKNICLNFFVKKENNLKIHRFNKDINLHHKYGWRNIIEFLEKYVNKDSLLDHEIDYNLMWNNGEYYDLIESNYAFIHLPQNIPNFIRKSIGLKVFDEEIIKLNKATNLKGIICLSEYMKKYIEKKVNKPVYKVLHPYNMGIAKYQWNYDEFIKNPKIVSSGWFLRKINEILKLKTDMKRIQVLVKPDPKSNYNPSLKIKNIEKSLDNSNYNYDNIEVRENFNNDYYYENILRSSILITCIYDQTGLNAFGDAIMSNTPIIINKHPVTFEIFGEDYPLYIENINYELNKDNNIIIDAHNYLKNMDKSRFNYYHFLKEIEDIIV